MSSDFMGAKNKGQSGRASMPDLPSPFITPLSIKSRLIA